MPDAPTQIPEELLPRFTMDGKMEYVYDYWNNTDTDEEYQEIIKENFTKETFDKYLAMCSNRQPNYYGHTDLWLWEAFKKYPVMGEDVLLFGSANPWYEAFLVDQHVKSVQCTEYGDRISLHEKITYHKPRQLNGRFKIGVSISSFEHDGLGRYGDPLNPDGDLEAMQEAKDLIEDGGLLFLSVPVGIDTLFFNSRRHYGRHRFPLLANGWTILEAFGLVREWWKQKHIGTYQPVFVLKNENS